MGVPEEEQALGTPAIITNGKNDYTSEQKIQKKLFLAHMSRKDRLLNVVLLLVIVVLIVALIIVGVKRPIPCDVNNKESETQKLQSLPDDSTDEVTETKCMKSAPCDDDWIWYRGKCYYFSTEDDTWQNSQIFCKSHNASLAHIDNQEELDFLFRYKGKNNHWIGLKRTDDNTAWTWINGAIYDGSLFKISGSLDENIQYAYLNAGEVKSHEETSTGFYWICQKT